MRKQQERKIERQSDGKEDDVLVWRHRLVLEVAPCR